MTTDLWHIITMATLEVRQLLDTALPPRERGPGGAATALAAPAVSPIVRSRLRAEIMARLSQLKTGLRAHLSEKDAGMVLLPLVIHIDELVMIRLSKEEQSPWPLIQRELFDVHNGGELFYEFAAEKLQLPDTPPILFQVLYFCLSDGFRGKYDAEPARIEQTRLMLVEKIALPAVPAASGRKRRARAEAEEAIVLPPAQARWFYLTALLSVLLIVGLTILFTNL